MNARQRRVIARKAIRWFCNLDILNNEELLDYAAEILAARQKLMDLDWEHWDEASFDGCLRQPIHVTLNIVDRRCPQSPIRANLELQPHGDDGFIVRTREIGCGPVSIGLLKSRQRKAVEFEKDLLASLPRETAPSRRSAL